ncbi:hypothetical protein KUTeg_001469 [Tegillarca granosa]|uniref:Aspartate/ornithine carbamoyltransferase carbamoyl-P binding domain-containing protein n=1 Tax=Tegillarca granosa TaxID=220873 RepID=A0ABQ9FRH4_TEGGR|nr:hypothetical protein KUTeg_001469 [Tegillarca granosa]
MIVRTAKERGLPVTCEVAPHHLFLTSADLDTIGHARGQVKPPLCTKEDQDALWENMDIIDCFATDHAPHSVEEKNSEKPPPGYPGLETMLPLLLTAVNEGLLTLDDLIARLHTNPRRIFNLPEQPDTYIEVDLEKSWVIPDAMRFTKSKWTPFAGKKVTGQVRRVVLRGEVAYIDGEVLVKPGFGVDVKSYAPQSVRQTSSDQLQVQIPITQYSNSQPSSEPSSPRKTVPSVAFHPKVSRNIDPYQSYGKLTYRFLTIFYTCYSVKSWKIEENYNLDRDMAMGDHSRREIGLVTPPQAHMIMHPVGLPHSTTGLHQLFNLAHQFRIAVQRDRPLDYILKGKVMASMFYEVSTRTNCSFTAAMQRLGGTVIHLDATSSSTQKGETLEDTVMMMSGYSDIIVIRHPKPGAVKSAAQHCRKPIINAGDGVGSHPTQALLDVFTIREEIGTVNGLTVSILH